MAVEEVPPVRDVESGLLHREVEDPSTLRKVVEAVRDFFLDFAALFYCLYLSAKKLICRISERNGEAGAEKLRPILLVHGFLHDDSAWAKMISDLEKQNRPLYTINFSRRPRRGIEDFQKQLQEKVAAILTQTPDAKVTLVAHSMGGLVSSLVATDPGNRGKIEKVVTLGTPFDGATSLAYGLAWLFKPAKQMLPHAPFSQQVAAQVRGASDIQYLHIGAGKDWIVPAASALTPKGSLHHYSDLGHVRLLYDKRVINEVTTFVSA